MSVKKLSGYFVRYILAIFIFVSCFIFKPADTYAKANTFGELKQELADLKAKQQANNNKKNLTKNQIALRIMILIMQKKKLIVEDKRLKKLNN